MALMAAREEVSGGYSRTMPIFEFDNNVLRKARDIFEDYKQRGVIIKGSFEDMSWMLTNETKNVGLTLLTFEGGAKKPGLSWIGCTYNQYITTVKAYILLHLGEIGLDGLCEITRFFNRLVVSDSDKVSELSEYGTHIISLLQFLPGGNERRDAVIEDLEEKLEQRIWKKSNNQRQLADFKSYLRFNELLAIFWQNATEKQKMFYFPLYFWWNLTAILPLRPMEFLLIPRDCTRTGENIITVRRTKLKGGMERIGYCIADDYELHDYTISDRLAEEVRYYSDATKNLPKTDFNTLFLQEPHYNYLGVKVFERSRYYSYNNLNTCRRYFYNEIISGQSEEISNIRLGDTRHLAMTNLILSGGSPVVCRELAGHSNIEMSSHYYTNISNLVECLTLERFRKAKNSEALISGKSKYSTARPQDACRVDGGLCTSSAFKDGRIDDCLKVVCQDGHIGDCRRCVHYLPDNQGVIFDFQDDKIAKERLDADSRYLISMIELVRKGLGYSEDIKAALLRLQHSGDHYGKCLWQKHLEEGAV